MSNIDICAMQETKKEAKIQVQYYGKLPATIQWYAKERTSKSRSSNKHKHHIKEFQYISEIIIVNPNTKESNFTRSYTKLSKQSLKMTTP